MTNSDPRFSAGSVDALALADQYEAGMNRALASGYEEFGPLWESQHRLVIKALRSFAAAQPVAWRYRHRGDRWSVSDTKPEGDAPHLFEVQPLYASQPSPAATVTDGSIRQGDVLSYTMDDGVGKVTAHVRPHNGSSAGSEDATMGPKTSRDAPDDLSSPEARGWAWGYNQCLIDKAGDLPQAAQEEMVPKRLLNGRDDFIVSKGLWSEFMSSLPRPESR